MHENDDYACVQRRLCAVMAKSEWTSSRMRMQKSGEELRERRAKAHQTANRFLQELFEKRIDSDLIDDNGAVDRYRKFVKHKSAFNDDTNGTLDEFDRRLRALNENRQNQMIKLNNQICDQSEEIYQQQFVNGTKSTIEIHNNKNDSCLEETHQQEWPKPLRILPSVTTLQIASTPVDTAYDSTTSMFQNDENQEFSNTHLLNISFIDSQTNHTESSVHDGSLIETAKAANSLTSSSNDSLIPSLLVPTAHGYTDTKVAHSPANSSLAVTPSGLMLLDRMHFPRSLKSNNKNNIDATSRRQLPSTPSLESSPTKLVQDEQFDKKRLYELLDSVSDGSQKYSCDDLTNMLEHLTLSTLIHNNHYNQNGLEDSIENLPSMNDDYKQEENILLNLFNQSSPSIEEQLFYTTLTINIDNLKNIFLYTMTISTVQISASILVPYSILSGRRPFLECSKQTHFKQIHPKQQKYTCRVTAIESSLNVPQLQQNDIVLKINDQPVWKLLTEEIIDILKQYTRHSNSCSVTIARLCQPFV